MNRLIATSAAALLLACGGQAGAPVSFSVATARPAAGRPALVVAGAIDIRRVRLSIGRLKLEGPASSVAPAAVAAALLPLSSLKTRSSAISTWIWIPFTAPSTRPTGNSSRRSVRCSKRGSEFAAAMNDARCATRAAAQ